MWIDRLREKFKLSATAFYGGSKRLGRITVTIYNTVSINHPELLKYYSFIVLDEVYYAGSKVFSNIIHRLSDGHKVMALTATLKREDDRHMVVLSKLPVAYCLDLATAIRHRLVAPLEVILIGVDMNQEERRLYVDIERKISGVENVLKNLDDREGGGLRDSLRYT